MQLARRPHMQQSRPGAIRQRLLRNQFLGKFVMEIGDQHALIIDSLIARTCMRLSAAQRVQPRQSAYNSSRNLGLSLLPAC